MKNRKRNRMLGFDYSQDAIYFITSCCKNRIHHFGEIINNEMILNENGTIVKNQIEWLEKQYPYFELHNYVVMPNHVHILFEINRASVVGTGRDLSLQCRDLSLQCRDLSLHRRDLSLHHRDLSLPNDEIKIKSVSSLIGAFKTTTSKQIHLIGNINFEWQRSFHDHIIRNSNRYEIIDNYITNNPLRWNEDSFNN